MESKKSKHAQQGGKLKRSPKTTMAQYELFLSIVEKDKLFRQGIQDSKVYPDYIQRKWFEVAERLNNLKSGGPKLHGLEWKRRFSDWRNSTRSKYRFLTSGRKRNRKSSFPSQTQLSQIEKRALHLWGVKAIKSCRKGIEFPNRTTATSESLESDSHTQEESCSIDASHASSRDRECSPSSASPVIMDATSPDDITQKNLLPEPESQNPLENLQTESKEVSIQYLLNDHLVHTDSDPIEKSSEAVSNNRTGELSENHRHLSKRKHDGFDSALYEIFREIAASKRRQCRVEEQRLAFEIAKYKFEHPGFEI